MSLLALALDLLLHLADLGLGICLLLEGLFRALLVILDLGIDLLKLGSSLGFGITDVCG